MRARVEKRFVLGWNKSPGICCRRRKRDEKKGATATSNETEKDRAGKKERQETEADKIDRQPSKEVGAPNQDLKPRTKSGKQGETGGIVAAREGVHSSAELSHTQPR